MEQSILGVAGRGLIGFGTDAVPVPPLPQPMVRRILPSLKQGRNGGRRRHRMKLVSYIHPGTQQSSGALVGDAIVDLSHDGIVSLRGALQALSQPQLAALLEERKAEAGVPLKSVTLLPTIPDPDKILCVGLNYRLHTQEAGMPIPQRPSVFVRFASSFTGADRPVLRPRESGQFDYEAELAVVIGRKARRVAEKDAPAYVAGYVCMAENSVRDWQKHAAQATPGKNFVHSGALPAPGGRI